ncbi:MAG: hypothetical protein JXA79_10585 [Deltaproteobacteria bacterium]|nr:hypothetical protein [Deltaproteobacteria bacterium]
MEKSQRTLKGIVENNLANLEKWTKNGAFLFSMMLIAGFLTPLFKSLQIWAGCRVFHPG